MADRYQPDLTLSSKALVVALINHDNGLSLSPDEIVITGVSPIDLGVESARSSQAFIAKARKPNGKKITVYYDRLVANKIIDPQGPILVTVAPGDTYADLATVVNQLCGLNLSREDISTGVITPSKEPLIAPMSDDSPAWMATFTFTAFNEKEAVASLDEETVLCIGDDAVLTYGDDA
ncbi:hypothetical protein EXP36_01105 [Salmonella enterica subsp. enterica serovar Weltevreden]|nr:hypothetical protein [Salmonella enterica subsp. enterica serovar Braenderup]EBX7598145.1 hypothetical protein [Salmonella enterica subsp. enterica serovar Virchow]ECB4558275.1 hypothetical protein [Salmonella enterica subsp. enterica serovar Weltevreden]MJU45184.1 hypothetical protein [Salmonella enterica subsp. enterica serovar Stanley]